MPEDVIDLIFDKVPFPGWALEHAAVTETSLMLYLHQSFVKMDRTVDVVSTNALPYFRYPLKKMMYQNQEH